MTRWDDEAKAVADRLCKAIDVISSGQSKRSRRVVGRKLIDHVSYWHVIETGTRYHSLACDLYAKQENIAYGKGNGLDACPVCCPDK